MYKRFWIEFEFSSDEQRRSSFIASGCGVTAEDFDEALKLVRENFFRTGEPIRIRRVVEDVDVSTLDPNHVLPNIGVPVRKGIWYPNLQR